MKLITGIIIINNIIIIYMYLVFGFLAKYKIPVMKVWKDKMMAFIQNRSAIIPNKKGHSISKVNNSNIQPTRNPKEQKIIINNAKKISSAKSKSSFFVFNIAASHNSCFMFGLAFVIIER